MTVQIESAPGLDSRLEQPAPSEMRADVVFAALSDPIRITIVQRLMSEGDDAFRSCTWVGIDRPKSTLTHHFRVLREAGVIEQRRYGTERRSRVRVDDLAARFPGLLDIVLAAPLD
ncbi:DNA-binding transcriptional ArsR family regulator [Mycetocola sp. BIGb0189]|uniref:ArsR/SmtB family transcription factor n=1 Tax=Mycetocola sp. BIGb0189 TaxID=2940604 RepID=UPI002168E62D|nr:helix-turn-helix domain-containing protein [Mycetocola sp. BIGb0189]MCS4277054.1 DNA-binding transcriptional ArsR family regulator [Mycetocola sp. BIGb0189]